MPNLTLIIPQRLQEELDSMAAQARRIPEDLALEALEHYLMVKRWQANELELALREAEAGGFATEEEVREVLNRTSREDEGAARAEPQHIEVRWCGRGLRSLKEVADWLTGDDRAVAAKFLEDVESCLRRLAEDPRVGQLSRREGVREVTLGASPYQLLYRIAEDGREVHGLEIFHVARRRPQHW